MLLFYLSIHNYEIVNSLYHQYKFFPTEGRYRSISFKTKENASNSIQNRISIQLKFEEGVVL